MPRTSVPLPTGTVTFLFTDIEGSTQRWEAHSSAMDATLKRHDALMRATIERHGGYIFKTVGDAFCAAFARVSDALAASVDAQRSLSKQDFSEVQGLRVRMALHTGDANERDGDYFGPAVNRVARLMSIGHGGQVLVSAATRELIQADLPRETSLTDLGAHRLKDLAQAQQVWQLSIAGLPTDFPPVSSLATLPNNLPLQVTSFVGRESDVTEIKQQLEKTSLLTLTGTGGVGKTRLALQVGADLLDRYPDGVWLVELAPLSDPDLVPGEAASALRVRVPGDRSATDAVVYALKHKRALLILDNCEHVLEVAARLAAAVIHGCPYVRILATSREALAISGEAVQTVGPLAAPDKTGGLTTGAALQYGAVTLFADRASAANTRFALTQNDAATVAEICRRLDGIPFAIELAAARVKAMSVSQLAQALNERFRILTRGDRAALPRQKTMRALIDWSYDLLDEREKVLFRGVGIFSGGWTPEAAASIFSGETIDAADTLDAISSLVDKSLVVAELAGEDNRYRLLESTREYALEKLAEASEHDGVARRHARFFCALAQNADKTFYSTPAQLWLENLQTELDNFRAALEWSLAKKCDPEVGGAIAGALEEFWYDAGLQGEGRRWIETALGQLGAAANASVSARLYLALSRLTVAKRSLDASAQARSLFESLGDRRNAASAQYRLAFGLYQMGRYDEAAAAALQAYSEFDHMGPDLWIANCLSLRALIQWTGGDADGSRVTFAQALERFRMAGNERGIAGVQANLAEVEFASGNVQRALERVSDALTIHRRLGHVANVATNLCNIAAYRLASGDLDGGREGAREALRAGLDAQHSLAVPISVQHLAQVGAIRGDAERAGRLAGYVDAWYRNGGQQREGTEARGYAKIMEALRRRLNEEQITSLLSEGARMSEDQAVEEALTI